MSNSPLDHLIPDFGEYAPEGVWSAAGSPAAPPEPAQFPSQPDPSPAEESCAIPPAAESISPSQRARREAMETFGQALRRYSQSDDKPSFFQPQDESVPAAIRVSSPEEDTAETPVPAKAGRVIPLFQTRTAHSSEERGSQPAPTEEDAESPSEENVNQDFIPEFDSGTDTYSPESETAEADVTPERNEPKATVPPRREKKRTSEGAASPSLKERFVTPILFFFAALISRRDMQRAEAARWPEPESEPLPPEMEPRKAAKFYGSQAKPLRLRCRLSLVLTLILTWMSLQLPMAGLLGKSLAAQAGVSLVLTLAVMILSLDVITTGLRQLFDLHPGAESLATLGAILCCLDSALVYAGRGDILPYCAAACMSLTAALWGQRLLCSARRRTFLAATGKSVTVMSVREGNHDTPAKILRSPLNDQSIVRRTEDDDIAQSTYASAAPVLILTALVLSVFASLNGQGTYFLHIFSALVTVCASLSAFFFFPLPYALAARRLLDAGAALLGWAGIADLGRRPTLVVTDDDIFPPDDDILEGHIRFSSIYLTEDADTSRVLSYTCSMLAASEGGLAHPFLTLAKQRWISLMHVEDFTVREGGGYSATIDGNSVLVGSAGFMKLMGVRIPPKMEADTAIYTAVHGELAASFLMEYTPTKNVQNALITLLRGRSRAVFALRNFCITPRVLGRMFRLSADRLAIPSFETRCKLAQEISPPNTASALYSMGGLMSAVDLSETGRRLRNACRISSIISVVSSALGMVILFLLFRAGAFAPASAGNLVLYMALWALPVIILSIGQSRQ